MIPAYFMQLEKIPLTPNGKIDRKALPEPGVSLVAYEAPRDAVEEKMAEIWSGILEIESEKIGIDDNFFKLGGHSIKATMLISRIHKWLNVKIPMAELFKNPTIRKLRRCIDTEEKDRYLAIENVEEKEYYQLSSAQKRLFIIQGLEPGSTVYNMPGMVILEGKPEREKLDTSFSHLIKRHESLRTSFEDIDEQKVQRIHDVVEFEIEYYNVSPAEDEVKVGSIIKNFIRPFDLAKAPLLRVGLIRQQEEKHILMVDMHHIVSDGTSLDFIVKDFMRLYGGLSLPHLRVQYKDFSGWQESRKENRITKTQQEYWLKQFEGEIPLLDLSPDFLRPPVQNYEGSTIMFELDEDETRRLRALAFKEGATLFMVLLSLFYILLSKLSGQEDIVVGTPTAGRTHAESDYIIGMFVNTLALRNYPAGKSGKIYWPPLRTRNTN
jgi:acyl carrier protein